MSAAPSTDVVDWELSIDELRAVREHLPGLVLPSFVPDGAPAEVPVDPLLERGLLAREPVAGGASWADALDRSFLLTLALQNAASIVVQVSAWHPGGAIAHSTVIEKSAASHLTVRASTGEHDGRATVQGTVIDQAWSRLAGLIPHLEVVRQIRGSATISTVASQAVVDAAARRDPAVLAAVVDELHVPADAVELVRGLAHPAQHGFRVKAFTAELGAVFVADWFGTANGWLRMSVELRSDARGQEVTPELITDAGTVTVTAQTQDEIGTELLGLIAGLIKERDV